MDGDTAKLLALLNDHGARLHALLTRLTLRPDVAEDLLQELFLKLHVAGGFRRAADPAAYARRTAIHLAFDWRRQRKATAADAQAEPAATCLPPLKELIRREELELVLAALETLPELGRTCLVLHYLEHEPYDAVAQQLGKTAHQVRALCHKGIKELRACFREKEVPHDDA